jgi:23S rRNA (adenine2503-C2)-methyltransferase
VSATERGAPVAPEGRVSLLALSIEGLQALLRSWGEPRYRADQVWQWLYLRLAASPEEMTNIPRALRRRLAEETAITALEVAGCEASDDGETTKLLFRTADGQAFETVLMRYPERNTVCVSSQIGCAVGCDFCATGQAGLVRDLGADEIVAQVLHAARLLRDEGRTLTNVVLMGMGEPLLNYDAVWRAIGNLHEGMGLGMRRFTISTSGIVPGIERLAAEGTAVGLAVSLHAPDDALRDRLVPINRRYPIEALLAAVARHAEATGRRPTFEYVLIDGVNDAPAHAERLAERLRGTLCHVNLIPLNATPGCDLQPSPTRRVLAFRDVLLARGIETTVRLSRGSEIRAGCGQLRGARPDQRQNGVT